MTTTTRPAMPKNKVTGLSNRDGYLMKKSPGMLKMWQRRWFVLEDNVLTYYKTHADVGIKFLKQVHIDDIIDVVGPDMQVRARSCGGVKTTPGIQFSPAPLSVVSGALLQDKKGPKLSDFDFLLELDDRQMTLRAGRFAPPRQPPLLRALASAAALPSNLPPTTHTNNRPPDNNARSNLSMRAASKSARPGWWHCRSRAR